MFTHPIIIQRIAAERQAALLQEAAQERLARQARATHSPPRPHPLLARVRALSRWPATRRAAPSHESGA